MKKKTGKPVKPPKLPASVVSLIPLVDYNADESFLLRDGNILDLIQIQSKDLNAIKDYDLEYDMISFGKLYKSFPGDLKLVIMNYPVDTSGQIANLQSVLEQTENPVCKDGLERHIEALSTIHQKFFEREFYLFYYSKNEKEHDRAKRQILLQLKGMVKSIPLNKKLRILFQLMNQNTSLSTTGDLGFVPRGIPEKMEFNPFLVSAVQPQGGISFTGERIVKKGEGYEACIHLYDFKDQVSFNWLAEATIFENTTSTVDIENADRLKAIRSLNSSMDEQQSRYADARHTTDQLDAQAVFTQLQQVYQEMTAMGEVLKRVHIRIYTYGRTQIELEERIQNIITQLETSGYKGTVLLDENAYEWQSLFLPASEQRKLPNNRSGRAIPSECLALGHPFHFSSLNDPGGLHYGCTHTLGTIIYDRFHKDAQRLSYCSIVIGNMGSGKSTTLKKMIQDDVLLGRYVRIFSVNNEYDGLVNYLGGSTISLDGTDGFLNPLQVYKTHELEPMSFIKHIAKISTLYRFIVPEADTYDIAELERLLRELYMQHMGYDEKSKSKITGLEPKEYPLFSDLLRLIDHALYSDAATKERNLELSEDSFRRIEKIRLVIANLVDNYGRIFNGYSSIPDFFGTKLIQFKVGGLLNAGEVVFNAQLISALNLLWGNLLQVGEAEKARYENGEITQQRAAKYTIYMDEAHRFVNARKLTAVKFLEDYVRESRKYFGSIVLATQSVRDMAPEGSAAVDVAAIKNLFSLAQYKFLFKQGADTKETIQQLFQGELPANDMEDLPSFEQGECVLLLSGSQSIRFHVDIPDVDLKRFAGGA